MSKFLPNSFQTPNVLVDELMPLLTGDEWKVLSYMTRHILGFQERITDRRHHISLSMFIKGNGTYPGCGLGQGAVRTCLESLTKFGIIKAIGKPTAKGQLWELCYDKPEIDMDGLRERAESWSENGKKRTANARSVRHNPSDGHKGYVGHKDAVMSDITPGVLSDINNQTHSSNTPSNTEPPPLTIVETSKVQLPPSLSKWNASHYDAYFIAHEIVLAALCEAIGLDLKFKPWKNMGNKERRPYVETAQELVRENVDIVLYVAWLKAEFKWRKPFKLALGDFDNNITKFQTSEYKAKQPKIITGVWAETTPPDLPDPGLSLEERARLVAETRAQKGQPA